jgi:hypothetical protein
VGGHFAHPSSNEEKGKRKEGKRREKKKRREIEKNRNKLHRAFLTRRVRRGGG